MSAPARSATSRAAAGSICCPASATACFTSCSACRATCLRSTRASLVPSAPSIRRSWRSSAAACTAGGVRSTSEATRTSTVGWLRRTRVGLERIESGGCRLRLPQGRASSALPRPLRLEQLLGAQHDDDSMRSPSSAAAARPRRSRRRSPCVRRVDALDVERAELVLDERRDVGGQPRHLRVVVADNQVDGIGAPLARSACARPLPGAPASEGFEDRADDRAREFGGEAFERVDVLAEEGARVQCAGRSADLVLSLNCMPDWTR